MKIWQATVGRQRFIELLQRNPPAVPVRTWEGGKREGVGKGEICLLWAREPRKGEMPVAVVVPEGEVEDFFAWTNTYLSNWSPITSYFRVFSDRELIRRDEEVKSTVGKLLEAASIGLIVAEAIGQSREGYDVDRVSMSACVATFSYAAVQSICNKVEISQFAREWSNCRLLTGQAPLRIDVESMLTPWEAIEDMVTERVDGTRGRTNRGKGRLFVEGLREVADEGEIGEATWRRITARIPKAQRAIQLMKGTHEERVIALETVLGEGGNRGRRYSDESSFDAGYLGSRVFPGTIKHIGLVLKYSDKYPSAALWLGLFAGLHERRELSMNSLGRHIWRAIASEESVLSRPRCDIGIRELRVLVEGGLFGTQYRTATPGRLVVELHPCVYTVVRWPVQYSEKEGRRQRELFTGITGEIGGVVNDLKEARSGLDEAIRRLERSIQK